MKTHETVMTFGEIAASLEVLHEDRRGYLVEQLDSAIAEAARRAFRYQGKASGSLTLKFDPEGGRMLLAASLSAKYPAPESIPVPAYVTRDGRLVADDPEQQVLPIEGLTSIDGGKA